MTKTLTKTTLDVRDVDVSFPHPQQPDIWVPLVNGVSFSIEPGKIMGLVGESGSGKSLTSMAVLGLLPTPGRMTAGEVQLEGLSLNTLSPEAYRKLRGNDIALIPQDPLSALNPVYTIGNQLEEILKIHTPLDAKGRHARMLELFEAVQLPNAEERLSAYPHEFSGGMRQRVLIAMALACNPKLLIADEPTTALDVTVQAEILALIEELGKTLNMATLLITHDMGVVAEVCDDVAVMYAGHIVELAPVKELFANPKHPYTVGLLNSIPRPGLTELQSIEGTPPSITEMPLVGCRFVDRCPCAEAEKCSIPEAIATRTINEHHTYRCWKS